MDETTTKPPPQAVPDVSRNSKPGDGQWAWLGFWVLVSFSAAVVGQLAGGAEPGAWYDSLDKPSFHPPPWLFGPVWTLLYTLMGIAAWLAWRQRGRARGVGSAIGAFVVQLVLNAAWTAIFFGLHEIGWALVELVALWVAIAATIALLARVSRPAAWLMLPYLAWVTFAGVLNATLWSMNR
jgi:tryptophan-rich sensory protein